MKTSLTQAATSQRLPWNFTAEPHLWFKICVCAGWCLPSVEKVCEREAVYIPSHQLLSVGWRMFDTHVSLTARTLSKHTHTLSEAPLPRVRHSARFLMNKSQQGRKMRFSLQSWLHRAVCYTKHTFRSNANTQCHDSSFFCYSCASIPLRFVSSRSLWFLSRASCRKDSWDEISWTQFKKKGIVWSERTCTLPTPRPSCWKNFPSVCGWKETIEIFLFFKQCNIVGYRLRVTVNLKCIYYKINIENWYFFLAGS